LAGKFRKRRKWPVAVIVWIGIFIIDETPEHPRDTQGILVISQLAGGERQSLVK
jgi:hypothetical protein